MVEVEVSDTPPTITGETSISHILGSIFDPLAGVTVSDAEDGDLTSSIIVVSNNIDIFTDGIYTVELEVTDTDGNTVTMIVTVSVAIPLANYLDGIDLSVLIKDMA